MHAHTHTPTSSSISVLSEGGKLWLYSSREGWALRKRSCPLGGVHWFHLPPTQSCFRLWPVSTVSIFPKPSNEPRGWQRVFILPLHFSFPLLSVTDWLGNGIWMPKCWHSEHLRMMEWLTSTKFWTSSPCGCHSFKAKSLAKKQGSWLIQTVTYCSMGSSCHL